MAPVGPPTLTVVVSHGGAAQCRLLPCSHEGGRDRFVAGPSGRDGGPPLDSSVSAEASGLL